MMPVSRGDEPTRLTTTKGDEVNGRRIAALLIAVLALVAAGCGGSSNDEASSETVSTVVTETTTPTEDTTATTDDSGTSTDVDLGNLSGECAQFAGVSTKIAQSLSGQDANIEDAAKAFDEIADQVPDEIKDDYQVISENFAKIADALKGVDLTSGQAPSPEALAKLQAISASMDSAEVQQASQHIETWVKANC
jgi:methyl-accepting chemotaxis protein